MTREEKNKLLDSIAKERNTYAEYANAEMARLRGKIEGADFILQRLLDYFHDESEDET